MPTRYSALSSTGRKGTETNQGVSDPASKTYVVKLPLVASDAEQTLEVNAPERGIVKQVILNVITAESEACPATVSIGLQGGTGTELGDGLSLETSIPVEGTSGAVVAGDAITYTLSGSDFSTFEAELVVEFTVLKTS